MAYMRNDLVSRQGYGDVLDTITSVAGGALKFYGTEQQAVGAAAQASQANRDLAAALAAKQGIDTSTLLLLGGVGLAAFLLLRKKSS